MTISIRALNPGDREMFRDFWLAGLKTFPVFFGGYAESETISPQMWRTVIQGPTHQIFGLFEDAALIGITAAFAKQEDPSGETAIFGMSFILPPWRGRGLSRLLYDTRLEWAKARPRFKRVVLSHRESNAASRGAHRRYGFTLTGRVLQPGPDGASEHEEFYEMALARPGA